MCQSALAEELAHHDRIKRPIDRSQFSEAPAA
jgi:hypothetical protein